MRKKPQILPSEESLLNFPEERKVFGGLSQQKLSATVAVKKDPYI